MRLVVGKGEVDAVAVGIGDVKHVHPGATLGSLSKPDPLTCGPGLPRWNVIRSADLGRSPTYGDADYPSSDSRRLAMTGKSARLSGNRNEGVGMRLLRVVLGPWGRVGCQ